MSKLLAGLLGLGVLWQIVIKIMALFAQKKITQLDKDIETSQNKVLAAEETADQLIKDYEDAKKKFDSSGGNA